MRLPFSKLTVVFLVFRTWSFLFFVLISKPLMAGDVDIRMTSKYDYAAVCDFSSARFYLLEKQIIGVIKINDDTSKAREFNGDGVFARYLVKNKNIEVSEFTIEAKQLFESDRNKQHLLNRLGIDYVNEPVVMVGCDDVRLIFYFKSEALLRVRLNYFFNE